MFGILSYIFQPTIDALFASAIPFKLRWRMLLLQPLTLITISIIKLPYLISPPFATIKIPNRHGDQLRTLLYIPKRRKPEQLSPLHISFHAGAFIAGFPEAQTRFSTLITEKTGAVVVAPHTRYAPKNRFPAAIDDAEDIVRWCLQNCERLWGADPKLVTVDGFSAGGNLALAICQDKRIRDGVKASVTFYAGIDLRIPPWEKPKPETFPENDPMSVFLPLYDSYAGPVRAQNMSNARLSPILAEVEHLPERMLLIVPSIDILVHEQLTFVERVKDDLSMAGHVGAGNRSCDALMLDGGGFHGFLELPYLPKSLRVEKDKAFNAAISFLKETHSQYGWHWSE